MHVINCVAHEYADKGSMEKHEQKHLLTRIAKKTGAAAKQEAAAPEQAENKKHKDEPAAEAPKE